LLSVSLASLTYHLIEKPIRFSNKNKTTKIAALCALMTSIACAGIWIQRNDGIKTRENAKQAEYIMKDLTYWHTDDARDSSDFCSRKFHFFTEPFKGVAQCFFRDVHGENTVLVTGDSHAHVAFESIADFNAARGVNTLLLSANSLINPITRNEYQNYREYANWREFPNLWQQLRESIKDHPEIHRIFIFTTSMRQIFSVDSNNPRYHSEEEYLTRVQNFINFANRCGKKVFIVEENPTLPFHIRDAISVQPFRPKKMKSAKMIFRADVLKQYEKYRVVLKRLRNCTIIYSMEYFCPDDICRIINEKGLPLYKDRNHLSIFSGGKFVVDKILKPYLEKGAAQ
ncbi:MAG: hypothetical protein LBG69_03615, partial [Zoogloeaceae bacterium]|nr:hypothetical protein [Zoogloeaceae bacterium]